MCRFYISLFLISYQVVLSTSLECSPTACSGEKCNMTRIVPNSVDTLTWQKDNVDEFSSSYQATNSCVDNPPSTDYAEYCFENSTNRIYILEILNPENHDGSTFSSPATTDKTTINLMEPDTLSSDNIETDIPINITKDIESLSVTVPCSKPQPTFTWNFKKSTTNFVNEKSQITRDSTGCTPPLMNIISTLNVMDLDSDITETSGDIDITVDVKFGDCKTVSTKIVTAQFITPVPECKECCRWHYNFTVLIITATLIVLVIIVVIISVAIKHCNKIEEKKCVYWTLNIFSIIGGLGGLGCACLAIAQIWYLAELDDCCQDTCQEEDGYNAAIAFVVLGFFTAIIGIGFLIRRYIKNRDQNKETSDTEMKLGSENMKPGSEKEKNGTSDRPLPEPKRT